MLFGIWFDCQCYQSPPLLRDGEGGLLWDRCVLIPPAILTMRARKRVAVGPCMSPTNITFFFVGAEVGGRRCKKVAVFFGGDRILQKKRHAGDRQHGILKRLEALLLDWGIDGSSLER